MQKDLKNNNESIIVCIIAVGFALLNSSHVIIQWIQKPVGSIATGIAHYYADYFLYVTQMAQGATGTLWYSHRFTNEIVAPTWIYWFNNLLGFIGSRMGFSPFTTYNISLMLLVVIFIGLLHTIFVHLFPHHRWKSLALLVLYLTASPFFDIQNALTNHTIVLPRYIWFSPFPVFNRLGGVPHQVFQNILFIMLPYIFVKAIQGNLFAFIFLIPLTVIATTANPIQILVLVGSMIIVGLWIWKKNPQLLGKFMASAVLMAAIALPAAMATNNEFSTPIFRQSKAWELGQYVDKQIPNFLMTMGPISITIPFAILALPRASLLSIIFMAYATTSVVLFFSPLPTLLATTAIRYLHPASILGLFLMSFLGAEVLVSKIKKLSKQKISARLAFIGIGLLYMMLTIPSLTRQIQERITSALIQTKTPTPPTYVSKEIGEALAVLARQLNVSQHVVLVDPSLSIEMLIPAFADATVFRGHPIHTLYPETKEKLEKDFFSNNLSPTEANTFLKDHRIGYILSPTSPNKNAWENFPFLQTLYQNNTVKIYQYTNE